MDKHLNGIDIAALQAFAQGVAEDPAKRHARFKINTKWEHQTRTVATVDRFHLSGTDYPRNVQIAADEPLELLGNNSAPNPQELLISGLNACLSVGYVVNASVMGITIHSLEIETSGELDLRGFLGMDESVNPGFDEMSYVVRIHTDAPADKVEELHRIVTKTSVNLANFSRAIRMVPKLEVITGQAVA
ncbi:OsmC family protein [Pseudomonas sichuanensis]|uniref:OsmC family protein n=1 Tax=Pseudomonas sichuanensis TaxID=2213015 RepID=UPI00244AAF3B|nr:OsmC family protein [Pseudomonas sichuanensis]MDH0729253.1 OsmC family protein [Pseudomonas sichuanensis]MDH1581787.1 OsmC family protein [Pseudomonas sichuanensis]MDH1592076.1 OsmC family protein [Pseudomonas sichuanensis]MDH1597642.1 OsmC family protein [Pseudomonas sichuanensis]